MSKLKVHYVLTESTPARDWQPWCGQKSKHRVEMTRFLAWVTCKNCRKGLKEEGILK